MERFHIIRPVTRHKPAERFIIDIRVPQYFLAVAMEESIIKAAETLHMTQPRFPGN